ncbi:MAG: nucleotidyltransferase family protein [Deltaproteobacteria bacterium]|nr:nucleotidyltransferase family protein [Deltaproteobacteria bacterium]
MKTLILAGGRGRRLGTVSDGQNKCMLKVKGKPLIEYSLSCAAQTDASEIIIVVGYRAEETINTYGNRFDGKSVKYVLQLEQKGLVNAIECAKDTIGGEDFMLMLGDELMINPRHQEMMDVFEEEGLFGICGVVIVEDIDLIKKTYSVIQSDDNRIYRLVEKPSRPMNNIMGTGNCIFRNEILGYIDQTPINQKRQEKELPDLIQCAIDGGCVVKSFAICDRYLNLNSKEELEEIKSYFAHL